MLYWGHVESKLLLPQFVQDVNDLIGPAPHAFYVTEGFRSIERSNALYASYIAGDGPRAAPGGRSAHNFGLAIDIALDSDLHTPSLQPTWDIKMEGWLWLRGAVNKHPRLRGGWWYSDWPHIEVYKWQQYKGWRGSEPHLV